MIRGRVGRREKAGEGGGEAKKKTNIKFSMITKSLGKGFLVKMFSSKHL